MAYKARMQALEESETPEDAAATLRGVWWDEDEDEDAYRTDFPPPPGFTGVGEDDEYQIGYYERALSPEEEEAQVAYEEAERAPYVAAATRARDAFFGFAPPEEDGD